MSGLHAKTTGTGSLPLALLHGWSLNLRVFDPLTALLGDVARCTAIDLPGHGRSAPLPGAGWPLESIATRVLNEIPVSGSVLLGWSLGGQVAIAAAAMHPERVRALVLIATSARFVAAGDVAGMTPEAAVDFGRRLLADPLQAQRDFLELQVRGSSRATESLAGLRAALAAQGAANPATLQTSLDTLYQADLSDRLPLVLMPALVIAGQHDRVTHPLASRQLAEALPNARFVEVPRAGHAPFLSHTVVVAALVREFLAGLA